ncbi:hypothetical protein BU24DRAFT_76232 [Aaosphaeria arxii CBS 175.79]|uniref:Uncharacterized protein n=1 Tax=Aaosphaeria arxii CBS 175.79 TaxID=1450172 RepID=A0A6A5X958_9PLEO|nr:uncharacterized protein BU24DRAFT_76232 [Aaosphaeria arxii CBS 175.79]KAF2009508.1 hypothetical protein BU24DRAFT_76232 [Aaosphaeria arxii CBS 175.79]
MSERSVSDPSLLPFPSPPLPPGSPSPFPKLPTFRDMSCDECLSSSSCWYGSRASRTHTYLHPPTSFSTMGVGELGLLLVC